MSAPVVPCSATVSLALLTLLAHGGCGTTVRIPASDFDEEQ